MGLAAWSSTTWIPEYHGGGRYDPVIVSRWGPVLSLVGFWAMLMLAWRGLDRYRLRPAWIFFAAAATIALSLLMILIVSMLVMTTVLALNPAKLGWHGLAPFPPDIYYIDRIPVFVDSTLLGVIVALTLLISLVFSIYPAIRASRANPIEAIRDE